MSRATVRSAVADWFASQNVTNLDAVYRTSPRADVVERFGGSELGNTGSGIAFIELPEQAEERIGIGGAHNGEKRVDYRVELHILFRANGYGASTSSDDENGVEEAFDDLLDSALARLRSDHTFAGSADSTLLEIGERGVTLTVTPLTEERQNLYQLTAVLSFIATEIINA